MAINLQDIRAAVRAYLQDSVTMSVTPSIADVPGTVNPNEEFTFSVNAENAGGLNAVQLSDVIYHVTIVTDGPGSAARLKVPAATLPARATPDPSAPPLAPNTFVSQMYVFRPTDNILNPGDSDAIRLKGKAGSGLATATVSARIIANVDEDWLFPTSKSLAATSSTEVQ